MDRDEEEGGDAPERKSRAVLLSIGLQAPLVSAEQAASSGDPARVGTWLLKELHQWPPRRVGGGLLGPKEKWNCEDEKK